MNNLNWSRFQELSGAETENFEKLCRGVVKRHFAGSGIWHELKSQPGVEFLIELSADHPRLGRDGEKVGWQCKWFQYRANGSLTSSARTQITESLDKTVKHVADINHWILWTHVTLSKEDQKWFQGLKKSYNFQLHMWNQDDLNELLNAPALDLRNSYFGELALTNEMLNQQHQLSIASVKERWLQQAHQTTVAEKEIRKIIGEKEHWGEFRELRNDLANSIRSIEQSLQDPIYEAHEDDLSDLINVCNNFIGESWVFESNITVDNIKQISSNKIDLTRSEKLIFYKLLAKLRSKNLPLSLTVTNALQYIEELIAGFSEAKGLLLQQLIAVIADAGDGKTQLSIEVSAPSEARPAGVYILGKHLSKGGTLDDLAKRIKFYNKNIENFESLLSAVNSAAERASCRLPIIIDGLNESEDIRDWKDLLAPLNDQLKDYPSVVLVCTSRNPGSVLNDILPKDTHEIKLGGFDEQFTKQAVKDYFSLYKIKSDERIIPFAFFKHPLTLKIFCEVTNREARNYVNVTSFPSSIYSLFFAQIEHVAKTIASNTNLEYSYTKDEVEKFLYHLGELLYEQSARFVNEDDLFSRSNLPNVAWNSNIINLLVQEGLILRECSESYEYSIHPIYDRLGGFLIASFLLRKNSSKAPLEWVSSQHLIDGLFGSSDVAQPLAEDILFSLVALMPKQTENMHFYEFLPEAYQEKALRLTPYIEERFLNREVVESYKRLLISKEFTKFDLSQLLRFKLIESHPLNALFLDDVLTALSVSDRDLLWTELVREESVLVIVFLEAEIKKVKDESWNEKSNVDLLLTYISWFLTSTVIELRDRATELLLNIGLKNPSLLFDIAIKKLSINDPYISERLLAASYAVACIYVNESSNKDIIVDYAEKLYRYVFSDKAESYTTHILARDYASNTIKVVLRHHSSLANSIEMSRIEPPYHAQPKQNWGRSAKSKFEHPNYSPFRMDFENYTIGRLIKGRANYDYENKDYIEVRENILWRIEELGWSQKEFKVVDSMIENSTNNYNRSSRPLSERYGKKYSWVAYYEMAGKLSDEDKLTDYGEHRFVVDVDPFFPSPKKETIDYYPPFTCVKPSSNKDWFAQYEQPDFSNVIELNHKGEQWVLLYGFISEDNKKLDRYLYCMIDTCFANKNLVKEIVSYTEAEKNIHWPRLFESYSTYIGEYYCKALGVVPNTSNLTVDVDYQERIIRLPDLNLLGINNGQTTNLIDRKIKEPVQKTFDVFTSACQYSFESRVGTNVQYMLSPWIVEHLNLRFSSTEAHYLDCNGRQGVLKACFNKDDIQINSDLLYLRKDLFYKLILSDKSVLRNISGRINTLFEAKHSDGNVKYSEFDSISIVEN